jgi:uncharacterized delta-60 repeat protein
MSGTRIGCVVVIAAVIATPAGGTLAASRDWAYALALQRDGKLVAVGLGGGRLHGGVHMRTNKFALARYTARGRLDPSFARGGKVLTGFGSYGANGVLVQRDGKILVSGSGNLARYRADGSVDTAFGRGGRIPADAFALQRNGKVVVVGESAGKAVLRRYDRRGRLDPSFGHLGQSSVAFAALLLIQNGGKILAAGTSFRRGGSGFALARYNANGTPDSTFGKTGKVVISFEDALGSIGSMLHAIALQPDGKIVAAGEAASSDFALARLAPDGALDPDFGDGGKVVTDFGVKGGCEDCYHSDDRAFAVAVQSDGKIVAAGESDVQDLCDGQGHSCGDFALTRYNTDGSLDQRFGNVGKVVTHLDAQSTIPSSSIAQSLVIQRDGKLVVAGLGAGYDFGLARYTTRGRLDGSFGRGGKALTDFGSG